jgi:hypothetical protein
VGFQTLLLHFLIISVPDWPSSNSFFSFLKLSSYLSVGILKGIQTDAELGTELANFANPEYFLLCLTYQQS